MTPHVDPFITELTLAASKPIVEKGIKKITEKVSETDEKISEIFELESKQVTVQCLERTQKYSALINIKKIPLLKRRIDFKHGKIRRCSIRPIAGLSKIDAIVIHDTGFTIDLSQLQLGEKYILDIDYELDDQSFLDALVDRSKPRETPGLVEEKYWMVAAFKHLEVFQSEYSSMELLDVDFSVDVAIAQDLNTKIPTVFREQIEQISKIAGPLGRGEVFKEVGKLISMKQRKYGKNSLDLLGKLQEVFIPMKFQGFLDVQEDFHYGDCQRGINEFDVGLSWPRSMIVISRADITLTKPVAKGTLVYKKSVFLNEIEKIFS